MFNTFISTTSTVLLGAYVALCTAWSRLSLASRAAPMFLHLPRLSLPVFLQSAFTPDLAS